MPKNKQNAKKINKMPKSKQNAKKQTKKFKLFIA